MGSRGREAFETRFNWSTQASLLLSFYEELSVRLAVPLVGATAPTLASGAPSGAYGSEAPG